MRKATQSLRYSEWASMAVRCAAVTVACVLALVLVAPASASSLSEVRFGETAGDQTRIVFDISGPVDYTLSGDATGEGRLIVDVAALMVDARGATSRKGGGLVSTYRYASQPRGEARFVFDFGQTAKIADAFVLTPRGSVKHHRLVIDLKASDKAAFFASLPKRYKDIAEVIQATTVADATGAAPQRPAQRAKVQPKKQAKTTPSKDWPIIVIDPGHGGGDPGAQGPAGTNEKEVTLAAALALSDMLKAKGRYRIVLTRADDSRLSLQHRARIARNAKPDLFISLHADAIENKDLRGGSVYTLSVEGKERSAQEALEKGEFLASDIPEGHEQEVGGILHSLAQRETLNNSSKFASTLVKKLKGVTPLLNNAHRQKDLRVLLAPEVPAVLLELAFISNKKDEKNLISEKWREKTMSAVAAAIDEFFESNETQQRAAATEINTAG